MQERNKIPIGVSPSWIALPNRINELAQAISRYSEHDKIMCDPEVADIITLWAKEIIGHCETIQKLKGKQIEFDGGRT